MDLSQETEDYIRESIEYSPGLPVSTQTLQLKLQASEQSLIRLRSQYLSLQAKLKDKDQTIERTRAESSMNAAALKKFVEENQRLAVECTNLLAQCKRWEKECALYDHDREALMDFGNEADERAKEAEIRVHDLVEEVRKLSEELNFYKCQYEKQVLLHVFAVLFNCSTHRIAHISISCAPSRSWCSSVLFVFDKTETDWDCRFVPLLLLAKRQKAIIVLLLCWFVAAAARRQQILSKFMDQR